MNCRQLRTQLYEYVEASLSARQQQAADAHLVRCPNCREAVKLEQQAAGRLSSALRREAEHLTLSPKARQTILENFRPVRMPSESAFISWFRRFGIPGFAVASILGFGVLVVLFWQGNKAPDDSASKQLPLIQSKTPVQIKISYQVQSYTFRQEGNMVVDTFDPVTNVVDVILWSEANVENSGSRDKNMKL